MNFEDEHYVRVYTRDTKSWLRWGWEGQAVFVAVMRKLDKAGVMDIDDPVEDVALVTGMPVEIVSVGLPRILKSGTFEVRQGHLICPRYIEGQSTPKSDAQRMRELRERRSAEARGGANVTFRNETVRVGSGCSEGSKPDEKQVQLDTLIDELAAPPNRANVTKPNGTVTNPNETVTDRSTLFTNAVHNAVQINAEDQKNPLTPSGGGDPDSEDAPADDSDGPTAGQAPRVDPDDEVVTKVFDFWKQEHGHPKAKLERKRRSRIKARLREGFTGRELCIAIRGAKRDQFLMGQNSDGKVYDGLQTLLRDAEQVERLMALAGTRRGAPAANGNAGQTPADRERARIEAQRAAQAAQDALELARTGHGSTGDMKTILEGIGGHG
jgi:hypothetical protein